MKRYVMTLLVLVGFLSVAAAQTSIDKPVATLRLTRQEMISQRLLKADVDKIQKAIGKTLDAVAIRQVLDYRIDSQLFFQYCEREKISVSDNEVNAAVAQLKQQLGVSASDADLDEALRKEGVFVDAKFFVKQKLLFQAYLQQRKANDIKGLQTPPSADEILKAYDLAKGSLLVPDTVRLSILYFDSKGKSDAEIKKGRSTLESMASTLKINASKFDELMLRAGPAAGYMSSPNQYVDKSAQTRSAFGADFFDTAFKLKAGEVSGVLESAIGPCVVRMNEFIPQKQLTMSDTVPGNPNMTIQQYLAYQIQSKKQNDLVGKFDNELRAQLRKEATVKIYDENLSF